MSALQLAGEVLEFWRRKRRVRALQRRYYGGSAKDEGVIAEYLAALGDLRRSYASLLPRAPLLFPGQLHHRREAIRCLHLGSGDYRLEGWWSVDLAFSPWVDMVADLTRGLPFADARIDYIHSEDFFEHIELGEAEQLVRECFRVLRPGGVMRVLTPDLRALVQDLYLGASARHLNWCRCYENAEGPCEALNMHLRMRGAHRFVYDEERLEKLLSDARFSVRRVSYNFSKHPALRFLDLRDFGTNLFLEAEKPS